jgi:hypothetical protein
MFCSAGSAEIAAMVIVVSIVKHQEKSVPLLDGVDQRGAGKRAHLRPDLQLS